jgi:hypothetical protein
MPKGCNRSEQHFQVVFGGTGAIFFDHVPGFVEAVSRKVFGCLLDIEVWGIHSIKSLGFKN